MISHLTRENINVNCRVVGLETSIMLQKLPLPEELNVLPLSVQLKWFSITEPKDLAGLAMLSKGSLTTCLPTLELCLTKAVKVAL